MDPRTTPLWLLALGAGLLLLVLGVASTVSELTAPPTRAEAAAEERRIVRELLRKGESVTTAVTKVDHRDTTSIVVSVITSLVGAGITWESVRRLRRGRRARS